MTPAGSRDPARARLQVVDADAELRRWLECALRDAGHEAFFSHGATDALQAAAALSPDVILLNLDRAPAEESGLAGDLARACPRTPLVLIAAASVSPSLAAARRAGAFDLLLHPFTAELLEPVVARALAVGALQRENAESDRRPAQTGENPLLVGSSSAVDRLRSAIGLLAWNEAPVLIVGESGSGKELIARSIHAASSRRAGPFLKLNCAAAPHAMMEIALFGVGPSTPLGEQKRSQGYLERAKDGSMLLDEISELNPALQPKLLRALQEREFHSAGGGRAIRLETRLLVTTNTDLGERARTGRFPEDLFRLLAHASITVPPLRERREDIPGLAALFFSEYAIASKNAPHRLSPEAVERLLAHDWPGNVRELRNVIQRAALVCSGEVLRAEHVILSAALGRGEGVRIGTDHDTLRDRERDWILQVLRETGGNRSVAARRLGVSVRTIRNKLALYRRENPALNEGAGSRFRLAA